ncbi:synaptic vesicle transporter [Aulographum hederae CBS 113979]|uniref:Synaptic vesicle transporter n=1 Tax=Aulographum hederae CBS 113979 TaxID=1176131 RepID=A0A6G1H8L5_9PEZI|nr:synaptic vesicle transporter [Aulographum hederae CBS 113979]
MEKDVESQSPPSKISHWKFLFDQGVLTPEILNYQFDGAGTDEDPYSVTWIPSDPRNPLTWHKYRKWGYALCMALAVLCVSCSSSSFTGGIRENIAEFNTSQEVVTLGVSLFVLGFAIGPLLFAPLSEIYGRQILYTATYGGFAIFNSACAASQNIWTLIILRFIAGSFGSSPLTNAGGVIADMFNAKERGVAMCIFAAAPFMGPVLGPIIGGFLGEYAGWRWIEGFNGIFAAAVWAIGTFVVPETYAPVLLRRRAEKLSKATGKVYRSSLDIDRGKTTAKEALVIGLSRPWQLMFREPIVVICSIYMAIVYGTLYMLFGAYPIVYQEYRGWSQGIGGLAFIGVAIGMFLAIVYSIFVDDKQYQRAVAKGNGFARPEDRLPACIVGGAALPIGLFWFAWTNSPELPWAASVAAGIPFGFGMVLVFLGVMNYLIDAYTIFAASVLAANAVLRSCFGAAFPLFTSQMYDALGIHWASSIPAFLALACVPFPFLFYKYGQSIRKKCKYSAEADAFMAKIRAQMAQQAAKADSSESSSSAERENQDAREAEEEKEVEALDYSYEDQSEGQRPRFERLKSGRSERSRQSQRHTYEDNNPFDLDRVNTRDSFRRERSRASSRGSRKSADKVRK